MHQPLGFAIEASLHQHYKVSDPM